MSAETRGGEFSAKPVVAQLAAATAQATMVYWPGRWDVEPGDVMAAELQNVEVLILTELDTLHSDSVLRQVLRQPAVGETDWFAQHQDKVDDALRDLRTMLQAEDVPGTLLIRLTAKADHGNDAQAILRAWIVVYRRESETRGEARYSRDRVAYQRGLENVEAQIHNVDARIRRHLVEHPWSAMGSTESQLDDLQRLFRAEGENDGGDQQQRELDAEFKARLEDFFQAQTEYFMLLSEREALERERGQARQSLVNLDLRFRRGAYDRGFQLVDPATIVDP